MTEDTAAEEGGKEDDEDKASIMISFADPLILSKREEALSRSPLTATQQVMKMTGDRVTARSAGDNLKLSRRSREAEPEGVEEE